MSDRKPIIQTQFLYEKIWAPTTREVALKIIAEEMPQTDVEATLSYLLDSVKYGKVVTLGECRFRAMTER